MNVPVELQLGTKGLRRALTPLFLDVRSVGAASTWAGSYHILSMGRHYDHYVITGRMLALPAIAGFPAVHAYERLTGKIRAAGVTGNIGEAIAAIVARRCLGLGIGDIAHVRPRRPFRSRKAPDYLMRLPTALPGPFIDLSASVAGVFWPTWIPVESKARSTQSGGNAARQDALSQLATYWSLIARSTPADVGYGLIVTLTYQPPCEVRVCLIAPKNQTALIAEVNKGHAMLQPKVNACLHGC